MIIAAFYGCSGSHQLTQLEDMQHWSPNGPSRTNGQNTVLTIKKSDSKKRLPKAQKTNQDKPRRGSIIFNICFLRFRKKRWIAPQIGLFQFWHDLTTSTHSMLLWLWRFYKVDTQKMQQIFDDKILGSMNALMSFNILSVAILAESAKYPTAQPSSRDNAIWDALPKLCFLWPIFGGVQYIWKRFFCFAILISAIFNQWIFLDSIW